MRVIVCGSRRWHDRQLIADRLGDLPPDSVVVHGCARGADRIAGEEAQKWGLRVDEFPADWERDGKAAGFIRNQRMADAGADLCIAFWDGRSSGTKHMMERARQAGIPVEVVT